MTGPRVCGKCPMNDGCDYPECSPDYVAPQPPPDEKVIEVDLLKHAAGWELRTRIVVAPAKDERALLREVHEAARQFLRFRGIDKERQDAALVRLVDATEAVKGHDATA